MTQEESQGPQLVLCPKVHVGPFLLLSFGRVEATEISNPKEFTFVQGQLKGM